MGAKKDYFHIWAHEFPVSKYPVNDFTKQLYTLRFKKKYFWHPADVGDNNGDCGGGGGVVDGVWNHVRVLAWLFWCIRGLIWLHYA